MSHHKILIRKFIDFFKVMALRYHKKIKQNAMPVTATLHAKSFKVKLNFLPTCTANLSNIICVILEPVSCSIFFPITSGWFTCYDLPLKRFITANRNR